MPTRASGPQIGRRLRAIHRHMSWDTFLRIPRKVGWKHEYYNGMAHIRPASMNVRMQLTLTPRKTKTLAGIRALKVTDRDQLERAFLEAFATAPEYADYDMAHFRKTGAEYLERFFGPTRGTWSPLSVVAVLDNRIVGAAMIKKGESGHSLDCLLVCPAMRRKALATALVDRVANRLIRQQEKQLASRVMLANEPSLAWHCAYGFYEVPDLWVASYRRACYHYEWDRHRELQDLAETELERFRQLADHWWQVERRLQEAWDQEHLARC
jgi:GNAT superfamily N-acetyltransferase